MRPGSGRRPARINAVELEKLCTLQCTDEEIAAWFGVSTQTIERRRRIPKWAELMERGRAKGRASLRREQFKLAQAGHATMLIWLGKQLLGQRDVVSTEVSGPGGGAIPWGEAFRDPWGSRICRRVY